MSSAAVWRAPADDQLSWFRADGRLAERPRPLDYTFEIYALTWGVTRALESLYFPLYEVRTRLVEGRLYLASVPSEFAERDLEMQLERMRDSGLRFTKSIPGTWQRAIKREVEEDNDIMAAFPAAGSSASVVAEALTQLRRTRGNQWFAATRAVFAPAAMLASGGKPLPEDASAVVDEALGLIRGRGGALLADTLERVGQGLVELGSIDQPSDVHWLEYQELKDALRDGRHFAQLVAERRIASNRGGAAPGPANFGPPLQPDAPRMHLLPEVLAIIS